MPREHHWAQRFGASRRGSANSTRPSTRNSSVTDASVSPPPQPLDLLERLQRVFSSSSNSSDPRSPTSPNPSTSSHVRSFSSSFYRGEGVGGSLVSSSPISRADSFLQSGSSGSSERFVEDKFNPVPPRRLGRKARKRKALGPIIRPKYQNQLQKEFTSKLTKFWRSAGVSEPESGPAGSPLPSDTSSHCGESPILPEVATGAFHISLPGIPEHPDSVSLSNSDESKMDFSRLVPEAFEGPKKEMQIKDAQDMYQTVLRNAERSNSSVPPYDFIELIGKGSFGRVYKCRERSTGNLVAVKVISIDEADFHEHVLEKDNTIDSFRKEVGILQQLKDSKARNINLIHDAFDLHDQLWIVSDYCTGGSVRTLMRANPPPNRGLEEHFIIPIARELALAIKSVHDIGVIHRDIKCANVYVNEEGEIQLGDFGIVGVMDDGSSKRRTIIGTPHYLPREMLVASSHLTDEGYGTEVDIWSYGITVYEMATGQPPHSTLHPEDVARVIENAPRLEGGDYSQELRDFVAFCLNSNPQERPSADALLKHPFIANTSKKYPTSSLVGLIDRYAAWEYKGGQRQSLFFRGGAAAPNPNDDDGNNGEEDSHDWNFSTSDNFNVAFERRWSHVTATQDFPDQDFEAPAGSGLPPIITKDLTPLERIQEQYRELSANRGERSLDRLWNPTTAPYELHTPVEDPEPLSDLPLRNMAGAAPTRESLIDLDSAAALDLNVPSFNFDFGEVATLKAKSARQNNQSSQEEDEEEEYKYTSTEDEEKRATMSWTFPSTEPRRATMDWTFPSQEPTEPDDPDVNMNLPPAGLNGQLPPGFRPNLQRTATEPLGQIGDFMHPPQPTLPTSSSLVRDSISSMIDLDMGLADPADIVRPSTASSATGSTMTDMTSGNPFDLEDDPEQNEIDRNRFSYHKQWQSESGQMKRRSQKRIPSHSRASSMTSTDSDRERVSHGPVPGDVFDYDYSRKVNDSMRQQLMLGMPTAETDMAHWPNFSSDSGLDESPQYPTAQVPRLGDHDFPLQQGLRTQGLSTHSFSRPREPSRNRGPRRELEFPTSIAPHPDALLEEADAQVVMAEMDRLLGDFDESLRATSRALRQHNSIEVDDMGSETDSGFDSSNAVTGDEDGF